MQKPGLDKLAQHIEEETRQRYINEGFNIAIHERYCKVTIRPGKKYTKVDVGESGKYMVDSDGNIFGIKAYGVINKSRIYGTLDSIDAWEWGNYTARKRSV